MTITDNKISFLKKVEALRDTPLREFDKKYLGWAYEYMLDYIKSNNERDFVCCKGILGLYSQFHSAGRCFYEANRSDVYGEDNKPHKFTFKFTVQREIENETDVEETYIYDVLKDKMKFIEAWGYSLTRDYNNQLTQEWVLLTEYKSGRFE